MAVTTNALNITAAGMPLYDGAGNFTPTPYTNSTWTPVLQFGGASVGITYITQVASYVRVGNQIFVCINIVLNSKGSSTGNASITGLPVACSGTNVEYVLNGFYVGMSSFPGTTVIPMGRIFPSSSAVDVWAYLGPSAGTITQLTDANFSSGTSCTVHLNGSYMV